MYTILYTALPAFTALYNISRCRVQSRYCRDSHTDQGCTKRVQPGKNFLDAHMNWPIDIGPGGPIGLKQSLKVNGPIQQFSALTARLSSTKRLPLGSDLSQKRQKVA